MLRASESKWMPLAWRSAQADAIQKRVLDRRSSQSQMACQMTGEKIGGEGSTSEATRSAYKPEIMHCGRKEATNQGLCSTV